MFNINYEEPYAEKESFLRSYLLNENGDIVEESDESSEVCYDAEKCHYLYLYGHGEYQVFKKDDILIEGEQSDDSPTFVQLTYCNFDYFCSGNQNLLVFVSQEKRSTDLVKDNDIQNTITNSSASEHKPLLQKSCIDISSCYKLVGNSIYKYFHSSSSSLVEEGNTYHGYRYFGSRDSCYSKCSENPALAETARGRAILLVASSISNMIVLTDINSPHYKAVCWLIYDDLRQLTSIDSNLIQRYILALVFFSTHGEEWERNLDFLSHKSECEWNKLLYFSNFGLYAGGGGAHCNKFGNVERLVFFMNNLSGAIVPEIYWLHDLVFIDLSRNMLSGTIPNDINHLENVKYISFSDNSLTGTVPETIGQLGFLMTLRLQGNKLTGTLPKLYTYSLSYVDFYANSLTGTLPSEIENLTLLALFDLYENNLSGSIPEGVGNLKMLQYIDFGLNSFTGSVPPLILTIPNIQEIYFESNLLSGSLPSDVNSNLGGLYWNDNILSGSIPSQLSNLSNLYGLRLENNLLTGAFPSDMRNLHNLESFFIQNNEVTGVIPFEDCDQFTSLEADCDSPQKVSCLCCSGCHGIFLDFAYEKECSSTTLKLIFKAKEFGEFVNFELYSDSGASLYTGWDVLSGLSSTHEICLSISGCYKLTIINFSTRITVSSFIDNRLIFEEEISEKGLEIFFGFSSNMQSLEKGICDDLKLCESQGKVNTPKREAMNKLLRITGLRNFLDESSLESVALCDWIGYLDTIDEVNYTKSEILQRYMLSSLYYDMNGKNWFNSDSWLSEDNYCDWFGVQCDQYNIVKELNLMSNNLNGTISTEIAQLRGISSIWLDNNHIYGSIPSIKALFGLEILSLSNNELVRGIPNEIGGLSSLSHIDLSFNKLTNTLPSQFGKLTNLQSLNTYSNKLSGKIPLTIFNLTQLKVFAIGNNYMGGAVSGLKGLGNLEVLDLSNNFFTGSLPISVNYTKMRFLQLSGNEFVGSVPSLVAYMPLLEELMIQNNQLTGSLPTQLGLLKNLSIFSISYNEFKGLIPTEIGSIQNLKLFHLHRNNLEGSADLFQYQIESQIADCGNMFRSPAQVQCTGCVTCCNELGSCLHINSTWPSSTLEFAGLEVSSIVLVAVFFAVLMTGIMIIFFQTSVSECYTQYHFVVSKGFQEGSAYRFLLSPSHKTKAIALVPVFMQLYILAVFISAADFTSDSNDWKYSLSCKDDSLICEDTKYITITGRILFAIMIFIFLGKDLLEGILMICESDTSANLQGMFAGFVVTFVTSASILVSTLYNFSTGVSNTDVLKDAVILLFLNSIDEEIYNMLSCFFPEFVETQEESIMESLEKHIEKLEGPFGMIRPRKEISEVTKGEHFDDEGKDNGNCNGNNHFGDDEFSQSSEDSFVTTNTTLKEDNHLSKRVEKLESELNDLKTLLTLALHMGSAERMNKEFFEYSEYYQENENQLQNYGQEGISRSSANHIPDLFNLQKRRLTHEYNIFNELSTEDDFTQKENKKNLSVLSKNAISSSITFGKCNTKPMKISFSSTNELKEEQHHTSYTSFPNEQKICDKNQLKIHISKDILPNNDQKSYPETSIKNDTHSAKIINRFIKSKRKTSTDSNKYSSIDRNKIYFPNSNHLHDNKGVVGSDKKMSAVNTTVENINSTSTSASSTAYRQSSPSSSTALITSFYSSPEHVQRNRYCNAIESKLRRGSF